MSTRKRPAAIINRQPKHKRAKKRKAPGEGSSEEVLLLDIKNILKTYSTGNQDTEIQPLPERFHEIELTIDCLSSTGDGLAYDPATQHVYVVPFSVPGDTILAKAVHFVLNEKYIMTDFIRVITPSPQRNDSLIKCPYFQTCSGCQFQMLDYGSQLEHKRGVMEKAYKNFSGLDPSVVPNINPTHGSPRQYGYRTKLTPHFDGPSGSDPEKILYVDGKRRWKIAPPIGFMRKGKPGTFDLEDCPIGTDVVRAGLSRERERVGREIGSYKRGATLLLRESTKKIPKDDTLVGKTEEENKASDDIIREEYPDYILEKTCITDQTAKATEYISNFKFQIDAGTFFQNNNSVLPGFIDYIRSCVLPEHSQDQQHQEKEKKINYLVDAYCGAGLFTVTLSSLFKACTGIDIAPSSILAAEHNVQANGITNAEFQAADATALFKSIKFPAEETVVVIDPPRKGCDQDFLKQLLHYAPTRIVYVSCNVHTQARDVGFLIRGGNGDEVEVEKDGQAEEGHKGDYIIESLKPFDFFPQTSHVEGVAVLSRRPRLSQDGEMSV
ncbi:MAG: hypothetical protein M1823_002506 [Watsoniomyces obsoletus]|nr:MAG: hypothetical protein M1823_002506 [Watsoniomyces obsoletus]